MSGIANLGKPQLREAAALLQKHGRGKDDVLVHMTREELDYFHALAAKNNMQLTVNPDTGLYEMGILATILPIVAGAVTTVFGGGPWGAALAGGATGAIVGDKKNGFLANFAMGALGGYGGFSASAGLAAAGAEAGMTEAATAAMAEAYASGTMTVAEYNALSPALQAGLAESATAGSEALMAAQANAAPFESVAEGVSSLSKGQAGFEGGALYQDAWGGVAPEMGADAADAVGNSLTTTSATGGAGIADTSLVIKQPASFADLASTKIQPNTPMGRLEQMGRGASKIGDEFMKDPWNTLKTRELGLKPLGMAALTYTPDAKEYDGIDPRLAPSARVTPFTYEQDKNPFGVSGNKNPFNQKNPYFANQRFIPKYAAGGGPGITSLAEGSPTQPRMVRGPGTGLSDEVCAQIDGGRPARLADGEFVVSADVVSALGGGSTECGAKKLYAMMDRIRRQAHGTKKQMRKVNEKRALPA